MKNLEKAEYAYLAIAVTASAILWYDSSKLRKRIRSYKKKHELHRELNGGPFWFEEANVIEPAE